MAPSHVHEVVNESSITAASIHVYSPPLETMHHYDASDGTGLRKVHREAIGVDTFGVDDQAPHR
jgi:hypothetical protein